MDRKSITVIVVAMVSVIATTGILLNFEKSENVEVIDIENILANPKAYYNAAFTIQGQMFGDNWETWMRQGNIYKVYDEDSNKFIYVDIGPDLQSINEKAKAMGHPELYNAMVDAEFNRTKSLVGKDVRITGRLVHNPMPWQKEYMPLFSASSDDVVLAN